MTQQKDQQVADVTIHLRHVGYQPRFIRNLIVLEKQQYMTDVTTSHDTVCSLNQLIYFDDCLQI